MDEVAQRMKILLYGQSGVGKTVEAMELAQRCTPDDKRILYIDTGEGWVSLLNHPQLMRRTTRSGLQGYLSDRGSCRCYCCICSKLG
jgi:ABC-type phosphonate transport system ATPase subunit